jgi:hypothetical protein
MNKRGMSVTEFFLTYGWAILVVVCAIGALAYFGVLTPEKEVAAPLRTYDCGNIFVQGTEATIGELQNASFALKNRPDQPLNETTFSGRFLRAYYDLDNCFAVSQLNSEGKISLIN